MGLLDRLFGKSEQDEEALPSHQERYDHHAQIDTGEWEQEEDPVIDLDQAQPSIGVDPESSALGQAVQQRTALEQPTCQTQEENGLIIVLTVMANEGDCFEGNDLLREFNASGLHIGKDRMFHRYIEQGVDVPLFSVCNVLNPGVFDPSKISMLQTRGVALFSTLPREYPGKVCFDALVEAANSLAIGLGGAVMNGERRPLTNRVLQQMREQVLEFEYCRELERRKAEQQERKW